MVSFPNQATEKRETIFSAIDKLLLVNGTLTIYYTHRSPVTITGPDAMALYEWLMTPSPAREWQRAYRAGMETTCKSAA